MFFGTMDAIMPAGLKDGLYFFILITHCCAVLPRERRQGRMLFAFSRDDGLPFARRHWPPFRRSTAPRQCNMDRDRAVHSLCDAGAVDQSR